MANSANAEYRERYCSHSGEITAIVTVHTVTLEMRRIIAPSEFDNECDILCP